MRRIFSASPYETKIGYARAVVAGDFIFVSGTTGLDPNGPADQPIEDQCRLTLQRIGEALNQTGSDVADVVRVRYIVAKAEEFERCWPQLSEAFGAAPPAATMIEAAMIDPAMRIEIEVTAYKPNRDT